MFDIHMHVIPGVDDGCGDLEESLEMVRKAAKQGIDTIIATPHSFAFDDLGDKVRRRFDSLREELQENNIPVRILYENAQKLLIPQRQDEDPEELQ